MKLMYFHLSVLFLFVFFEISTFFVISVINSVMSNASFSSNIFPLSFRVWHNCLKLIRSTIYLYVSYYINKCNSYLIWRHSWNSSLAVTRNICSALTIESLYCCNEIICLSESFEFFDDCISFNRSLRADIFEEISPICSLCLCIIVSSIAILSDITE